MFRDFHKHAGMPVERWLESLKQLEQALERRRDWQEDSYQLPLSDLADFYLHYSELAAAYEKDEMKAAEHQKIITNWREQVLRLMAMLGVK
jgi:hypothetical protein